MNLSWTHSGLSFQLLQTAFVLRNFLQTNILLCGGLLPSGLPDSELFEESLARIDPFVHWFDVGFRLGNFQSLQQRLRMGVSLAESGYCSLNLRTSSVAPAATNSGARFDGRGGGNVATTPHRVGDLCQSVDENLWTCSRIRIHGGKTKVWNAINDRPEFCDTLEVIARRSRVWRGSDLILGTPLGHPHFVEAHLNKKIVEHEVLLERTPTFRDLQSAWSLLLHCASARANYLLRVVSDLRIDTMSVRDFACGGRSERRN